MFSRTDFLYGLVAGAVSASTPAPAAPVASKKHPTMECSKNAALPYDRPLEIHLPVLDGPDFRLSDYRGRLVLLNIFATWCGPCKYEASYLVAAAAKYADDGLSVIGIDMNETDDTVRDFRKIYGVTYPIAMDRRGILTHNVQLDSESGIPASLFITPKGFLGCYVVGNFERDDLNGRIEILLAATKTYPSASPVTSSQ